mgnify:CR=1 FL=1
MTVNNDSVFLKINYYINNKATSKNINHPLSVSFDNIIIATDKDIKSISLLEINTFDKNIIDFSNIQNIENLM